MSSIAEFIKALTEGATNPSRRSFLKGVAALPMASVGNKLNKLAPAVEAPDLHSALADMLAPLKTLPNDFYINPRDIGALALKNPKWLDTRYNGALKKARDIAPTYPDYFGPADKLADKPDPELIQNLEDWVGTGEWSSGEDSVGINPRPLYAKPYRDYLLPRLQQARQTLGDKPELSDDSLSQLFDLLSKPKVPVIGSDSDALRYIAGDLPGPDLSHKYLPNDAIQQMIGKYQDDGSSLDEAYRVLLSSPHQAKNINLPKIEELAPNKMESALGWMDKNGIFKHTEIPSDWDPRVIERHKDFFAQRNQDVQSLLGKYHDLLWNGYYRTGVPTTGYRHGGII